MKIFTTSHARLIGRPGEEAQILLASPGVRAFSSLEAAKSAQEENAETARQEVLERGLRTSSISPWEDADGGVILTFQVMDEDLEDSVFIFAWAITETELELPS